MEGKDRLETNLQGEVDCSTGHKGGELRFPKEWKPKHRPF